MSKSQFSPFDIGESHLEDSHQKAVFFVIHTAIGFGTFAALHPDAYRVKGFLATHSRPLTELQKEQLGLVYAIPNGATLAGGALEGARLKSQGMLSGVPDIHVPHARHGYYSLYVELKKFGGTVSPSQKIVIPKLQKAGHCVRVEIGWRSAVRTIFQYLEIPIPSEF